MDYIFISLFISLINSYLTILKQKKKNSMDDILGLRLVYENIIKSIKDFPNFNNNFLRNQTLQF
uniref:Uncharacterized protein n=1 Tax=Nelumbo nucifera TaxID=4432 RepID=A0A822Z5C9_NELNU|nr:TPA_asm: hypothetical protein HUJ06_014605 [Nelumbo nucifera]